MDNKDFFKFLFKLNLVIAQHANWMTLEQKIFLFVTVSSIYGWGGRGALFEKVNSTIHKDATLIEEKKCPTGQDCVQHRSG